MDKVTRQCPQTTTFLKRKENQSNIEPRSFCLPANALPLGQSSSRLILIMGCLFFSVNSHYGMFVCARWEKLPGPWLRRPTERGTFAFLVFLKIIYILKKYFLKGTSSKELVSWPGKWKICGTFTLQALCCCSIGICATKVLSCFRFELLSVQMCLFALHQWRAERVGSWCDGHVFHTCQPCSCCHRCRLTDTSWF